MGEIFINDNALVDFERAGVEVAFPLWVDSVKLLSRTGDLRMTLTDVEELLELGDYDRDASSMAAALVSIGYWGVWGDIHYLIANGSWALNEPEEFADDLENLGELRLCERCPEVTSSLVSLASELGAINRRTIVEELHDFFAMVHRDHSPAPER